MCRHVENTQDRTNGELELWTSGMHARIPVLVCNVEFEELSLPDHSFDVIFCTEVIEHLLGSPMHMFKNIHRLVKPDRLLVLTTPNGNALEHAMKVLIGYHITTWHLPLYHRHTYEYFPNELSELIRCCGFKILIHKYEI